MSDYNKVIKNENGITTEEFMEVLGRTINGNTIYVNVPNPNGGFPIAVNLKSASSLFGCLYIDVPELNLEDEKK